MFSGKQWSESMTFTINFGPPDARVTEHPIDIFATANRYRYLEIQNALDITVQNSGRVLDPRLLLRVSPAKTVPQDA
jgi:hypothetical protein